MQKSNIKRLIWKNWNQENKRRVPLIIAVNYTAQAWEDFKTSTQTLLLK
jgi:hypothetical protein